MKPEKVVKTISLYAKHFVGLQELKDSLVSVLSQKNFKDSLMNLRVNALSV